MQKSFDARAGVIDSRALESLRTWHLELSPTHAGGDEHDRCVDGRSATELKQMSGTIRLGIDAINGNRRDHLRAELEHLKHAARGELCAADASRKSDEVFDER